MSDKPAVVSSFLRPEPQPGEVRPMKLTRTTYLVNPRLQWQIILGANVLALVSAALLSTLMFYSQSDIQNYSALLPPNHPLLVQIAARQADFLHLAIVMGVIQLVLFNASAVFLSHRIAGPLYRLERHLSTVGAGSEPCDVRFRKGDLYQPLAEACNMVMARLRRSPKP